MSLEYRVAELQRKLAGMIQITTITVVDHANKTLRVRLGTGESAQLPHPAIVGNNFVAWRPLRVGQQVVLLSPNGDPSQGVIVGELYSQAIDSPSTDAFTDLIQFGNGNKISHNNNSGEIHITASGNVHVIGDVIADGISLKNHTHNKVRAGADNTGKPQ